VRGERWEDGEGEEKSNKLLFSGVFQLLSNYLLKHFPDPKTALRTGKPLNLYNILPLQLNLLFMSLCLLWSI
jgi:hypothetical protein